MADPMFLLAADVEGKLDRYGAPRRDAGASLSCAAFNLCAARVGVHVVQELGGRGDGLARLQAVLPEDWDVLEVAAMSLGFGDVATALDTSGR